MKQITILLVFTLFGITLTLNTTSAAIVTDGLVSYWSFDQDMINDGIVEDIWGENDATILGNPKIVQGLIKDGIRLDGDGDCVRLPNFGNFGKKSTTTYTFEVWFKTSYKDNWSAIYKVQEPPCTGPNDGYGILINASRDLLFGFKDAKLETKEDFMYLQRTEKFKDGCSTVNSVLFQPVSDGKWHHLVYTSRVPTREEFEEANMNGFGAFCRKIFIYLDTRLIYSPLNCIRTNAVNPYTETTLLGAANDAGFVSGYFQGVFDEVRIYDSWLSQEQVRQNYRWHKDYPVEPNQKLSTVWGAMKRNR